MNTSALISIEHMIQIEHMIKMVTVGIQMSCFRDVRKNPWNQQCYNVHSTWTPQLCRHSLGLAFLKVSSIKPVILKTEKSIAKLEAGWTRGQEQVVEFNFSRQRTGTMSRRHKKRNHPFLYCYIVILPYSIEALTDHNETQCHLSCTRQQNTESWPELYFTLSWILHNVVSMKC